MQATEIMLLLTTDTFKWWSTGVLTDLYAIYPSSLVSDHHHLETLSPIPTSTTSKPSPHSDHHHLETLAPISDHHHLETLAPIADASERFSCKEEISCRYARGVPSCPAAAVAALASTPAIAAGAAGNAAGGLDLAAGAPVIGPGQRITELSAGVADTAASASSSNKRRGVVLGKKTAAITKEKGRTPVTYKDSIRGPPFSVRSRFVTNLSAYIKDRCPMLHPTWHDLPVTERTRLLDFLSVNNDIDHRCRELTGRIDEKAANRFRQWKSSCHPNWQELGDSPLLVEFAHRPAEWQWLCHHFRDPGFQRRSEQMKAIRASTNKRPHSGGARPFAARADEYTRKGEQAPHAKTYIDMYKKFDREGTSRVQQASDEAVASLMESMPPIEDTSDGTSPASVTAPPRLSVDVEIGLMERVVGPSRGTKVPGLGSGVAKQPRTRGPSRGSIPRSIAEESSRNRVDAKIPNLSSKILAMEDLDEERDEDDDGGDDDDDDLEEFARLRENQKELEERLHQERRDRQERERQLERERQDRDRERLEFEARVQAQLAEMARQMNMRAPPSDGSNA
ncbi:hypothetical protein LguiB_012819 [Lonicera macranthoides]